MPRLTHPSAGTVVTCEGDLAERYRAAGWSDSDEAGQQGEATSEKPKTTTRRARKPRAAE